MDKFPFLGSSHTSLIEKMYEDYLKDSSSVHKQWRDFFQGYNFAKEVYNEDDIPSALRKEFKVIDLIEAYNFPYSWSNNNQNKSFTLNLWAL